MNEPVSIMFTRQELDYLLGVLELRPHREVASLIQGIHMQTRTATLKARAHPAANGEHTGVADSVGPDNG